MGQSFPGVKNWSKASFKINHTILAQVLGLLVSDSLECVFRLHHRDGVRKTFQIFCEAPLVSALMKPIGQGRRIAAWKVAIVRHARQVDYGFRSQDAVQMLV